MKAQDVIFLNSVFFVLGFMVVFSIVGIVLQTLISSTALAVMNELRIVGGSVIIIFGIALILSTWYFIPIFASEYKMHVKRFGNSYVSSFVFGVAFAIGWTPCVGPILGSIYALALTSPGTEFLLLLAYSLGLGIPFLIVGAFVSKLSGFMKRIKGFLKYFNIISGLFLIALGTLVVTDYIGILSVFLVGTNSGYLDINGSLNFLVAIIAGILTFLSPCILPLVPAYFSYIGGATIQEAKKMKMNVYIIVFGLIAVIVVLAAISSFLIQPAPASNVSLANLQNYGPAANIQGISAWINSPPLNMSQLKGKVVIVDFWTYSCINCIRTIPFLNALEKEYGKYGLVIIGVSTPEFQFEHNLTNVENAVKMFNITYPVALDNNYSTWEAYNNHYWPADYFVDKNGNIRYESFGESPGAFNQTQQVVRELLKNANYDSVAPSVQKTLHKLKRTIPIFFLIRPHHYKEERNNSSDNKLANW